MMKPFFLVLLSLLALQPMRAQSVISATGICSHLQVTGRVQLQQDGRLTELLGTRPKAYYAGSKTSAAGVVTAMGYRIRVFSGNQQNVSKNRAYKIAQEINELYPELKTYVVFKSPNWRLVLGDFRTSEEANAELRELRRELPQYGKEMFIVREEIVL